MLATELNLVGLLLITGGSLGAARSAPAPQYGADGSVSLSGVQDKDERIAIYRRQKHFCHFLWVIAAGALLQAIAICVG